MRTRKSPPTHPIDISEEGGVRALHFGSDWVQGAMRIARPWSLELEYTRDMMAGVLMREPGKWPRSALLIGLGAGSLARFIYRHLPDCRSTVIEINPQVEFIARQYFRLPDDPRRLAVDIGCGAEFVQQSRRSFDLILADGFDADGRPGVLDSLPFYLACRERLTDDGLFCVNLLREKGYHQSVEKIRSAFSDKAAIFPPSASGNTIVFARRDNPVDLPLASLRERAAALRTRTRLNLQPLLQRLESAGQLVDGHLKF